MLADRTALEEAVLVFLIDNEISDSKMPEFLKCGCQSCLSIVAMYTLMRPVLILMLERPHGTIH